MQKHFTNTNFCVCDKSNGKRPIKKWNRYGNEQNKFVSELSLLWMWFEPVVDVIQQIEHEKKNVFYLSEIRNKSNILLFVSFLFWCGLWLEFPIIFFFCGLKFVFWWNVNHITRIGYWETVWNWKSIWDIGKIASSSTQPSFDSLSMSKFICLHKYNW